MTPSRLDFLRDGGGTPLTGEGSDRPPKGPTSPPGGQSRWCRRSYATDIGRVPSRQGTGVDEGTSHPWSVTSRHVTYLTLGFASRKGKRLVYIHTNTHAHTRTHTFSHVQRHTLLHTRTYVLTCTRTHTCTHGHTLTHRHTHVQTDVHTHVHTRVHTRTHTLSYNTHTVTRVHTHVCVYTPVFQRNRVKTGRENLQSTQGPSFKKGP